MSQNNQEYAKKGSSAGWGRVPATIALSCVVLFAAWMGNLNGGYFTGDWTLPAFILIGLLLIVSAAGALRVSIHRAGVLALGLFTAYTAWTFASMLWSSNAGDAWIGAGQTLLYLLAFWVAVTFVALGASRRWVLAASVLGPSVIAAFTLSALGTRAGDLFKDYQVIGTVGYHNGEAAFLLVSFWVAVYLGGSRHVNPLLRGAVLAGAVLCLSLAVLTQSRGAMVAMAVSLPVFFLLSGRRLRGLLALAPLAVALVASFPALNAVYLEFMNEGSPAGALERVLPTVWLSAAGAGLYGVLWGLIDWRWRPQPGLVRTAGAVALACCLLSLAAGGTLFAERVGSPTVIAQEKWEAFRTDDKSGLDQSRYMSASGSGRYTLWQVAAEDFSASPVTGVGTHNYEATYYQLREQDVGALRQPHSLPLEVLGERGVVGGALFFGIIAVCLGTGLWGRFRSLRPEGKAQVGALAAAVTYWCVHASAEWLWQLPAATLPVMVYLALLVSPWQVAGAPALSGWPLRAVGVGVAILALAVLAPLYISDRYLGQSRNAENPQQALAAVERAQDFNPLDSRLPRQEAEYALEAGDWDRVERAYDREIALAPEHYAPYMFRADYHERRGEPQEALVYYEQALDRNPLHEDLRESVTRLQGVATG